MTRFALPLLLILGAAAAASADDAKALARRYAAAKGSWERRALVEGLDANDSGARKFLLGVLAKEPWYQREGAIAALSRLKDEAAWKKLLKERKTPVLEGVARALGKRGGQGAGAALSGGAQALSTLEGLLGHKTWQVRRAAAIALRGILVPGSIPALIKAWEKEKDFRVWIHCLESLEALTGEADLARAEDWRGWWEAKQSSFSFSSRAKKTSGERIRTQARGTNLQLKTRGRGLPLLVLPEYGYEQIYLETYLRDLEDTNQILYLSLPGAADFTQPKLSPAPGLPDPYYPIDRLVESLEALHAQLVAEKKIQDRPFAILAHGMTAWIAMQYAAKHPKRVRKMILIAPYSGGAAWEAGRDRVEARGRKLKDLEMEHFAQSQLYDGYEAQGDAESTALERKEFSLYFADQRDLEIGRIFGPVVTKEENGEEWEARQIARALGTVVIPEFKLSDLPRVRVPVLVCHGDHSVRTSLEDAGVVAKHFGGKVQRFKKSARMPFYEEHDGFLKLARKFLR
jgi:pimeloyl-ACP methyl ester carboxylesterase